MQRSKVPAIPTEQAEWLGGGGTSLRQQRPLPNAQLECERPILG
jgi:hypothetical protein